MERWQRVVSTNKMVQVKNFRASIKGSITITESSFDYLKVLSMPQVPLNSCKSLLFHGGDTGSIPVRDANTDL